MVSAVGMLILFEIIHGDVGGPDLALYPVACLPDKLYFQHRHLLPRRYLDLWGQHNSLLLGPLLLWMPCVALFTLYVFRI